MMDLFEQVCNPTSLRSVNERIVSAFAAGLRKLPGYGGGTMQASSIKIRLQFLHTALQWAEDQKLIPECPRFPTVKVPKKRPQPVPAESFERMLAKAPDARMRHASIKTTMDYYANVDDAAMEAVLGAKRNRIRNRAAEADAGAGTGDGASACQETTNP